MPRSCVTGLMCGKCMCVCKVYVCVFTSEAKEVRVRVRVSVCVSSRLAFSLSTAQISCG